jgi:hypothetical protein
MSTSPTLAESKPSPWLTMAVPVVITLLGLAVQWGTLGADGRHLERRTTLVEAELFRLTTAQSSASTQAARIEEQIAALSREVARLTTAIDKLTDDPRASR